MRIERLRIPAFGPLRELDTGPEPLPGFVVVTGPNEAGKSSLLEAIRTLLHGIYPARRENHPLVPWDGAEAAVWGELRTRDGRTFTAHRRILATPWGRLERDGEEEDLRNAQLPGVDHVPEAIYRQVHAVLPVELAELQQGKGWEVIRDRILAGMGTRDLAPPRKVAGALAEAAGALWRNDRRGQPADRRLGERIEVLTREMRAAREHDLELRQARTSLAEGEAQLGELRRERAELEARVRRASELLPLAARLRHLSALRDLAGDTLELARIPEAPRAQRRERIETEAAGQAELDETEAALRGATERRPPPVPGDEEVLAREAALQAIRTEARGADEAQLRAQRLQSEREGALDDVLAVASPVLGDPERAIRPDARDGLLHLLQRLPLDEMRAHFLERRAALQRERDAADELASFRARPVPSSPRTRPRSTVALLLGMGVLLLLAATASLLRGAVSPVPGILALAGGVAMGGVALWIRSRDRAALLRHRQALEAREAEEKALDERRQAHGRHAEETLATLRSLLGDLELQPGRLEHSGEGLATALERLRDQLRALGRLERGLEEEEERVRAVMQRIHQLAGELAEAGVGTFPGEPASATLALAPLLTRLEEALDRAERLRDADREILLARERRDEAARRYEAARERRLALDRELLAVHRGRGGDAADVEAALDDVERRLDAWRQARGIAGELEAQHGSLEELAARVEAAQREWSLGPGGDDREAEASEGSGEPHLAELASARGRLETLGEEIEATLTSAQRDRSLLERADAAPTVDLLESELARLREERDEIRMERDRLWLLGRVTEVAEMRFREEHQPALILRAEGILERLTRGRYDTLVLGDEQDPEALQVWGSHLPGHLPVEAPLSTGTREQIWFALRMAVVELVEGGGEPLPLVLDELLVNWDPERQGAALDTLAELASDRQIFLVTCHPALAREAEARGARLLRLPDPPDVTSSPPSTLVPG